MINRITKNEQRLDSINESIKNLETTIKDFESKLKDLRLLNNYYCSKNWIKDKDNYENNKIPKVKAGVLSEDAIWNMNEDIKDLIKEMESIIKKINK